MLILGGVLAVLCGVANSVAAGLQKSEGVRVTADTGISGMRLVTVLVRRGRWLVANAIGALGWVAEAAALALAPVPLVTSLRSLGRGGLVVAGHRWLGERFTRLEVGGIAGLAIGGIITASSVWAAKSAAAPLPDWVELVVAAAAAALAGLFARSKSGIVLGSAVGILFAATGVFTKEVGDRFSRQGISALGGLLASPGPWLMVALTVWAVSILQKAFSVSNTATVSATNATVSSVGLIVAVEFLYRQRLAAANNVPLLVLGIIVSAAGCVAMVVGARPS
ncbi:MAG: hypothetical protein ACRDYC_01085, partial [Acidimicrobiales bacterium]